MPARFAIACVGLLVAVGASATVNADENALPRVLILGDSISIGYTPLVRKQLEGEATVVRPMRDNGKAENCAGTTYGVAEIDRWLKIDGGNWDVIHFNFGLHDLKRIDSESRANSNDPDDPRQAEPDTYERNLRAIVERLKATGAVLVFATTTPVPEGKLSPHRDPGDVERYNAIAHRVMGEAGIEINDLFAFASPILKDIQRPANVHFTPQGSKQLAGQVAVAIRKKLDVLRPPTVGPVTPARRPNILFFLSDDQRADLMGCAGHPFLKTPTMDRLAAEGVRFQNTFVTTSICAASRATLLTGVVERTHKYTFGTPPIAEELCRLSYPAVLRRNGYRTGLIGKFGVGVPEGTERTMFDVFEPLNRTPYFKPQPDGTSRYVEEIAGDRAVAFLRSNGDRPFCLQVCFNAPHAEDNDKDHLYPAPPCVEGMYDDIEIPAPPLSDDAVFKALPEFLRESMNRDRWYWQFDTREKYVRNVRGYYRMISGIDAIMGRVLDELKRLGQADNTIVIFSSDNGYFLGERGLSGKWIHYEESLRVPLIIYDPRIAADHLRGRVVEEIALNVDVPATILRYARINRPDEYQGSSLVGLAQDTADDNYWRTDFFVEHLMENPDLPKWEGVRSQRFTYARYFEQNPPYEFLHDRRSDPNQLTNFANDPAYAAELTRLRARTDELRDEYGGEYSREKFPLAERARPRRARQTTGTK